jgi:hypothetical protein
MYFKPEILSLSKKGGCNLDPLWDYPGGITRRVPPENLTEGSNSELKI